MTLDEAIRHAEEVAEYDCYNDEQKKCADEHRQLAEWLKELKRLKEAATDTDTISRQAAIEAVHCHVEIKNKIEVMAVQRATAEIIGNIAELPSAEPERKKGQWIRHDEVKNVYGGTCVECSECGEKYVVQHTEDEKYCRNCGADMRGGNNE